MAYNTEPYYFTSSKREAYMYLMEYLNFKDLNLVKFKLSTKKFEKSCKMSDYINQLNT